MSNTFRLIALAILAATGGAALLAATPENAASSTSQLLSGFNIAVIALGIMILLAGGKTASAFMRGGR